MNLILFDLKGRQACTLDMKMRKKTRKSYKYYCSGVSRYSFRAIYAKIKKDDGSFMNHSFDISLLPDNSEKEGSDLLMTAQNIKMGDSIGVSLVVDQDHKPISVKKDLPKNRSFTSSARSIQWA